MDALQKAIENAEHFTFVYTHENPKYVLYGKSLYGSHSKDGVMVDCYHYILGETLPNGEDFSMHYFGAFERLVTWLNEHEGTGYYEFLVNEYEKSLKPAVQKN